jgi:hypothetical protein
VNRIAFKSALLALIISLVGARPALAAYIDPSTGGMLFQLLAVLFAVFSGIMLFFSRQIRVIAGRAKRYLGHLLHSSSVSPLKNEPPDDLLQE